VGDQFLVAIASRLETHLRPGDALARLGGDEFAVLIEDFASPDEVCLVAERLQRSLAEPIALGGRELYASASIGIVLGGAQYHTVDDVLRDADIAMYRAKGSGRGGYQLFDPLMHATAVRRLTLERAFGKDGVPALLIEQALPQIEDKANELLDRLSDGHMSVRFVTQTEYKDKKRDDLKETLEIQISDTAGIRNYEMYSGGEAFRVNFAIRLALSKILAQRKGARLQTLVVDEGFGSQDTQGRQRLIEAINLVKNDFAKILVITHLDELKDAFPTRIEVEKTDRGSTLRVI
jgi:hypothetical protein